MNKHRLVSAISMAFALALSTVSVSAADDDQTIVNSDDTGGGETPAVTNGASDLSDILEQAADDSMQTEDSPIMLSSGSSSFSIDLSVPDQITIGVPDDFTETANQCYDIYLKDGNGYFSFGFGAVPVTEIEQKKYLILTNDLIPPCTVQLNVDAYLVGDYEGNKNEYFLGHLDTFGPYNIQVNGTVAAASAESGNKISFTLSDIEGITIDTSDYFEFTLEDRSGSYYKVSPWSVEATENGFAFNLRDSTVNNDSDGYLPEGDYSVSVMVYHADGSYYFASDGSTVHFAKKGVEANENAACTVMINDATGRNFTINCTGLTEEELNDFRVGNNSMELTDPSGNPKRINSLVSSPTWDTDNGTVSLSVNAEQLRQSDAEYIPGGSIPVNIRIYNHINQTNRTYALTVEDGSASQTLGPIKTNIADKITVEATEDGSFCIKGDPEVLNNLYNHAFQSPTTDKTEDINHMTEIYLQSTDYSHSYNYPGGADYNCALEWHDPDAKDYLVCPPAMLRSRNVVEGYYWITIQCDNADEYGYATTRFGGEEGIHLTPPPIKKAVTVKAVQLDDYSIVVSVEAEEEDFLWNINNFGLTDMNGRMGSTSLPASRLEYLISEDGNPLTITFPGPMCQGNYGNLDNPDQLAVVLRAAGYETVTVEITEFRWPFKDIAENGMPFYIVTGEGVVMKTRDKELSDAALSTDHDMFDRWSNLNIMASSGGTSNVIFTNTGSFPATPYYIVEPSRLSSENGVYANLIPIKYEQLEEAGITAVGKDDKYYFVQTIPEYRFTNFMNYSYSLTPIYAKYLIDLAVGAGENSIVDLEKVDETVLEVKKENLNNCTVQSTSTTDPSVQNLNVGIAGAVGGAVNDDLTTLFETEPVITVETAVSPYSADLTAEEIESASGLTDAELTDVAFDITLTKTYDTYAERNGTVDTLPYGAAVTFTLPEESLAEGQEYQLVSEHAGEILTYSVTVQDDGTGLAYVDKYSSFMLVKAEKKEEEPINPEPVPAPAEPTKDTSGSADTGSAVTCQMAGYPEGYVWNESAQACQAGFVDEEGRFHASRKVMLPDTGDTGLKTPVHSLIGSMFVLLLGTWVLKKWS